MQQRPSTIVFEKSTVPTFLKKCWSVSNLSDQREKMLFVR